MKKLLRITVSQCSSRRIAASSSLASQLRTTRYCSSNENGKFWRVPTVLSWQSVISRQPCINAPKKFTCSTVPAVQLYQPCAHPCPHNKPPRQPRSSDPVLHSRCSPGAHRAPPDDSPVPLTHPSTPLYASPLTVTPGYAVRRLLDPLPSRRASGDTEASCFAFSALVAAAAGNGEPFCFRGRPGRRRGGGDGTSSVLAAAGAESAPEAVKAVCFRGRPGRRRGADDDGWSAPATTETSATGAALAVFLRGRPRRRGVVDEGWSVVAADAPASAVLPGAFFFGGLPGRRRGGGDGDLDGTNDADDDAVQEGDGDGGVSEGDCALIAEDDDSELLPPARPAGSPPPRLLLSSESKNGGSAAAATRRSLGGAEADAGKPGIPGTGARAAANAASIARASAFASSGLAAQRGTRLHTARVAIVAAAMAYPSDDSTGCKPSRMIPSGVPLAAGAAVRCPALSASAQARQETSKAAETAMGLTGDGRAGSIPPEPARCPRA